MSIPSCPYCGEHGNASEVNNPDGRYFCSCGSLFWGTDSEWNRLAKHRRYAAERQKVVHLAAWPRHKGAK